jgi:hypothetical protein
LFCLDWILPGVKMGKKVGVGCVNNVIAENIYNKINIKG